MEQRSLAEYFARISRPAVPPGEAPLVYDGADTLMAPGIPHADVPGRYGTPGGHMAPVPMHGGMPLNGLPRQGGQELFAVSGFEYQNLRHPDMALPILPGRSPSRALPLGLLHPNLAPPMAMVPGVAPHQTFYVAKSPPFEGRRGAWQECAAEHGLGLSDRAAVRPSPAAAFTPATTSSDTSDLVPEDLSPGAAVALRISSVAAAAGTSPPPPSTSTESSQMELVSEAAAPEFELGQVVDVLPRQGPRMNRLGGVGRVTRIGTNALGEPVVDVKYILSSTEDKQIELYFVRPKIINDKADVGRVKRSRSGRQIQPVITNVPEDTQRSGSLRGGKKHPEKSAEPAALTTTDAPKEVDKIHLATQRQWAGLEKLVERLSRLDNYAFWQDAPPVAPLPGSESGPTHFRSLLARVVGRAYAASRCRGAAESLARLREELGMSEASAGVPGSAMPVAVPASGSHDALGGAPGVQPGYLESLFEASDAALVGPSISWHHFLADFEGMIRMTLASLDGAATNDAGLAGYVEDEEQLRKECARMLDKGTKLVLAAAKKALGELRTALQEHRAGALEQVNRECAVPFRWRKKAFGQRVYDPIDDYVPGSTLTEEEGERVEGLRATSLVGFCGGAYNFDDHELQEEWMTGYNDTYAVKPDDDAVRRVCVSDILDSLCTRAENRVLNEQKCLERPLLTLVDRMAGLPEDDGKGVSPKAAASSPGALTVSEASATTPHSTPSVATEPGVPEGQLEEQPVWGVDSFCRRNVELALQSSAGGTSILATEVERHRFVEFVLLPAINAQPPDDAHDMRHALRWLLRPTPALPVSSKDRAAAAQVLGAIGLLGLDAFKIHPKGTGVVVRDPSGIPPHTLVNFYIGETFPSWRWGEKADGVAAAQASLGMKPQLPDFYNILLERPRADPKGWGLVYVDASRRANLSSSLSHSCAANCSTFMVATEGRLKIAVCTTRAVAPGEELTMDYNSVTSDENEWCAAICLCGTPSCRGSFLHFAAHEAYMQIVNKKYGPCYRFGSLLRQCRAAKVGFPEKAEDAAILERHGFGEAALGLEGGLGVATPTWLRRFIADTLRYVEFERKTLPMQLMKATNEVREHGTEKKGETALSEAIAKAKDRRGEGSRYTLETADGEARQMMEQRAQSLMAALSRVRRALALVASEKDEAFATSEVPLRLLTSDEAMAHLWQGPTSVAGLTVSALKGALVRYEEAHVHGKPAETSSATTVTPLAAKTAVAALLRTYLRRLHAMRQAGDGGDEGTDDGDSDASEDSSVADMLPATAPPMSPVASLPAAKAALLRMRKELRSLAAALGELDRALGDRLRKQGASPTALATAKRSVASAHMALRQILSPMALCDAILLAANTETFVTMNEFPVVGAEPLPIRVRDLGCGHLPSSVVHQLRELQSHQELHDRRVAATRPKRDKRAKTEGEKKVAAILATSDMRAGTQTGASPERPASREPPAPGKGGSPKTAGSPSRGAASLDPEMVVIEHRHKYSSDFVVSQLLQWYNYGEGTRTPSLEGCVLNPNPLYCLMKNPATANGSGPPGGTRQYGNALRFNLLQCLLDEESRTMPFPVDVADAFGFPPKTFVEEHGMPADTVFGSPVLDLVLSDSAGLNAVTDVLKEELKVDDEGIKEQLRSRELRMENSIPVQPATWVQCEDPACMKWRKLPWYVDADKLPKEWFCAMNEWCPELASCSADEQNWDPDEEATVAWQTGELDETAHDGRQSLTVASEEGDMLAVAQMTHPEEKFQVGQRLDVYCKRNKCWYEASVMTVLAEDPDRKRRTEARIRVHFVGWSKSKDEWILLSGAKAEVGRVAPFRSRTSEYVSKHWSAAIKDSLGRSGKTKAAEAPKRTTAAKRGRRGNSKGATKKKRR